MPIDDCYFKKKIYEGIVYSSKEGIKQKLKSELQHPNKWK
jgi:hypothetical protein